MGFIKDLLQDNEEIYPLTYLKNGGAIYTPNRRFLQFLDSKENDRHDVAYVVEKTKGALKEISGHPLSIIEGVRVRIIVENIFRQTRSDYDDIPRTKKKFSQSEFGIFWKQIVYDGRLQPEQMIDEVVQRSLFEIFDSPIECVQEFAKPIPVEEIVMLCRERYRRNNPFSSEEYLSQRKG